jgi:hypothetical protein
MTMLPIKVRLKPLAVVSTLKAPVASRRQILLTLSTTERQDQRFNRRIGMAVDRMRINLADLLADRTNEAQPGMTREGRGADA